MFCAPALSMWPPTPHTNWRRQWRRIGEPVKGGRKGENSGRGRRRVGEGWRGPGTNLERAEVGWRRAERAREQLGKGGGGLEKGGEGQGATWKGRRWVGEGWRGPGSNLERGEKGETAEAPPPRPGRVSSPARTSCSPAAPRPRPAAASGPPPPARRARRGPGPGPGLKPPPRARSSQAPGPLQLHPRPQRQSHTVPAIQLAAASLPLAAAVLGERRPRPRE